MLHIFKQLFNKAIMYINVVAIKPTIVYSDTSVMRVIKWPYKAIISLHEVMPGTTIPHTMRLSWKANWKMARIPPNEDNSR